MWFANLKSTSQIFGDIDYTWAIEPPSETSALNFCNVEHRAQIYNFWLSVSLMILLKIWNFYNAQIWAQNCHIWLYLTIHCCCMKFYYVLELFYAQKNFYNFWSVLQRIRSFCVSLFWFLHKEKHILKMSRFVPINFA